MQKSQKILLNIIILSFLSFIPKFVFAARFPFFGPIVPCGREGLPECNLCHFFELGQNIIDFMLTLIFLIAPVMIIVGGIYMLTSAGAPGKVAQGKQIITYTIIALLIAFGSWLIVNEFLVILAGEKAVEGGGPWPWPWNEINCGGTTSKEEPTFTGGTYCVCEVPVYDLDPNQYPSQASIIGKNIKVTGPLASGEACQQACVLGNVDVYCPFTLKKNEADLYCADESTVKSKKTCAVKLSRDPQCYISQGECWKTSEECAATLTPGISLFNPNYAKRCFLNGQPLCSFIEWANGSTYCPKKAAGPCTPDKPYALYRFAEEKSKESLDALACSRAYYGNTGYVCRLDCQYDKCSSPEGEIKWRFQSGVQYQEEQKADATTALKNFLDCFYKKAPEDIGFISAITDKDIYNGTCDPQKCKTDACTLDDCGPGNPCDHSCHSCHYGGTCSTTKSYAVDFGDEENVCQIAEIAYQCGGVNKIFGPQSCGGKVVVDNYHNDHVHISVINSCNCN